MFTDLLWGVAYQHATEMRQNAAARKLTVQARQAREAGGTRGARGALRRRTPRPPAAVRVPGYIDGTFRTGAATPDPVGPAAPADAPDAADRKGCATAHRESGATAHRSAA